MADKTPSDVPDVPPVPMAPLVDLTGAGEPEEKTTARPRKKAEPKVVPPAVPPVEAAPVVSAAEAAPAEPVNPYAAAPTAPPAPPNPYASAPAAPAAPANPYAAAPGGPAAPGAPQPYSYGPYVPQPPKGLSIASMILGIVAVVFCGTLFLVSVAAVVTGHIASKRQPYAKGMWLTGIIGGYAGIALGLLWGAATLLPWIFRGFSGYGY